jgi:hypothetical protein
VGVFVAARGTFSGTLHGGEWPTRPAPWLSSRTDQQPRDVASPLSVAIEAASTMTRFPSGTFSDPGVHTGNVSKQIIVEQPSHDDPRIRPVREGKDIGLYLCGPPRKGLVWSPGLEEGQYCRIGDLERYRSTPIVLRQTADRPIATRHMNPTYFRNTLLACRGLNGVPDEVVVAVLNSCLMCLIYRSQVRESGQRAFPQVKIRYLHELPLFATDRLHEPAGDVTVGDRLVELVHEVEAVVAGGVAFESESTIGLGIEELVLQLYGLPPQLADDLWRETYGSA